MASAVDRVPAVVEKRYLVGEKIGEGSFGSVFEGVDTLNDQAVAIKFEPSIRNTPQLSDEWRAYRMLAGLPGIPQVYHYGVEEFYNFLVIDRLGLNLEDLFSLCGRRFSLKTVCLVAQQMITRVRAIHEKNLIYQNINPKDLLIGLPGTPTANVVHVIDFGMAKLWRDPMTKEYIPCPQYKPRIGTPHFMSIKNHLRLELSCRDDLESLGYVLIYFLRGNLPWQSVEGTTNKRKCDMIGEKKHATTVAELCAGFPEETVIYMDYVRKLGFQDIPDYDFLHQLFRKMLKDAGETDDGMMDWMLLNEGKGWEASIVQEHSSSASLNDGGAYCNHNNAAQMKSQSAAASPLQPRVAHMATEFSSDSSVSSECSVMSDFQNLDSSRNNVNIPPNLLANVEGPTGESSTISIPRDAKYYFEDGSVTLRVDRVLFKVHTSLLRAHSEDFLNKLGPSQQSDRCTTPVDTCDENIIIIPDIRPSQFRNLLKVIYCLPSSNVVFAQRVMNGSKTIISDFDFYLDVAILSRKFSMEAMQEWARERLNALVHKSGKILVEELDGFYEDIKLDDDGHIRNDHFKSYDKPDDVPLVTSYPGFRFMETLKYAQAVSDNTLFYDILSALEYYCMNPGHGVELLVSFFRIENLRKTDPSLFGFLFLLLLCRGNLTWMNKVFTRDDRMALFSAQSFLTPLPISLKSSIVAPIFTRPTRSNDFAAIFSGGQTCEETCSQDYFLHWQRAFSLGYYDDVNNKEFLVSAKALATLPLRRFEFAIGLDEVKCEQCNKRILGRLDQDIQEVFARLTEYYKVYD